jgi:Flp pilus assembly protein TadD
MGKRALKKRLAANSAVATSPRSEALPAAANLPVVTPASTPRPGNSVQPTAVNAVICALLLAAVALVFVQTGGHAFVNFDDDFYVYENTHVNQGLTFSGLQRAFTRGDASNWHPLTWISHMVDCQVYQLWAGGHHLTSAAIHAAVAILLFLTLLQMTGCRWPSAVVAAVFAIHPLRVESVAWVAERKDVLSGLFFVLTLAAYVNYVRKGESWGRYLLVWLVYLLGLSCKPMLVTLPLVLLLLDYWPLGRWGRVGGAARPRTWPWNLVVEKVPLLVLSLLSCIVTLVVQEQALVRGSRIALSMRLGNALLGYVAYLCQFVWPERLAVYYPYSRQALDPVSVLGCLALLLAVSWGVVWQRRRRPYLLVGWLWYLITLVPVIGLVQVSLQARADRYTYLTLIGPCLGAVWAGAEWVRGRCRLLPIFSLATCIVLAVFATSAWRQTAAWRNSMSLWTQALAAGYESDCAYNNLANLYARDGKADDALRNYQTALRLWPDSGLIHANYGIWLVGRGRVEEGIAEYQIALALDPRDSAVEVNLGRALIALGKLDLAAGHFRRAMEINPENSWACYYLGSALVCQGRSAEAVAAFQQSLKLDPRMATAANDLANILRQSRRFNDAEVHYRRAIEIDPDYAEAHNNLGLLLAETGQREEAATHFQKALKIKPEYAQAHNNYGVLLMKQGMFSDAIAHFHTAIAVDPKFDLPHANLGRALSRQGQTAAAAAQLRQFLRLQPDQPQVLGWLAWILATAPDAQVRSGQEAVALAEKAAQLTARRDAGILNSLAAAYAETGRYAEAVEVAQQALTLSSAVGPQALVAGIRECLDCYRDNKPYRQAAPQ